MSLYRRYRPQDFDTLRGQDHVREILLSALQQEKVSHAYLFSGPRGTGKTSTARILARAINCTTLKPSGPCNACENCRAALDERLTDFIEIDAASHGLVEDARALVEQARFLPTQAKKKIYLIDEVHMLSKSAFNALLKIIEEPPEHVHFILATTEPHKVIDTILSRCQRFDFRLASEELVIDTLREVSKAEGVSPSSDALQLLAQQSGGSFRDALSLLEQVIGWGDFTLQQVQETLGLSERTRVSDFLAVLFQGNRDIACEIVHDIHEQGGDLYQFCQDILRQLRQLLLRPSAACPAESILLCIEDFLTALDQLRDPIIAELPLEMAVMKSERHLRSMQTNPDHMPKPQEPVEEQGDSNIPVTVVERPVPKLGTAMASFDIGQFVAQVKPASLRSLLKFSQINLENDKLSILAKSPFELEKLKQNDYQSELGEVMRSSLGKNVSLHLGLQSPSLPPEKGPSLQAADVQSIF